STACRSRTMSSMSWRRHSASRHPRPGLRPSLRGFPLRAWIDKGELARGRGFGGITVSAVPLKGGQHLEPADDAGSSESTSVDGSARLFGAAPQEIIALSPNQHERTLRVRSRPGNLSGTRRRGAACHRNSGEAGGGGSASLLSRSCLK